MDEDGFESLVESTTFIPCATRGRKDETLDLAQSLPILDKYERIGGRGPELRCAGYVKAKEAARRCFKASCAAIYSPVVEQLSAFVSQSSSSVPETNQFFLPGLSGGDDSASGSSIRLPSACLTGAPLNAHVQRGLIGQLTGKCHFVQLNPNDGSSLPAALRMLVAQALAQSGATFPTNSKVDKADLKLLDTLPSGATLVVSLRGSPAWGSDVLNDVIQAIHGYVACSSGPKVVLFFDASAGHRSLLEVLHPDTLRLIDITTFTLPSGRSIFENFVEELYLGDSAPQVQLGHQTLDLLRRRFFEQGTEIDDVVETVELALFHHFTVNPLSALLGLEDKTSSADANETWHAAFFELVRQHILGDIDVGEVATLEVMLPASKGKNKMRYLSTLIGDEAGTSSEQHLAEELPTFLHALDRFRRERRVGLRLLHRIEEALRAGGVASTRDQADEEGAVALGPTSTSMAALIIKLLETDERHSSSLSRTAHLDGNLSRLAAAIRKLSANDLAALFELLDADGLLKQSSSPRIIKEYQGKIEGVREQKRLQEEVDGAVRGSQEASRLDLVQKQLLRQEEFEGAKKGLETWLVQTIRDFLRPSIRPPLYSSQTYNATKHLASLIDPNPRVHLLVGLTDPSSYLVPSSIEAEDSMNAQREQPAPPDVCVAYDLYRNAGRMINIADWFGAFEHSVEPSRLPRPAAQDSVEAVNASPTKRSRGKKRNRQGEDEDEDDDDDDNNGLEPQEEEKAMVRARFALAINELSRMGLLKRTRRKADHVLRTVWDLSAADL